MKDVTIKDSAPRKLLLQKHVDYIAAYGTKKDDYVSPPHCQRYSCQFESAVINGGNSSFVFSHQLFLHKLLSPASSSLAPVLLHHIKITYTRVFPVFFLPVNYISSTFLPTWSSFRTISMLTVSPSVRTCRLPLSLMCVFLTLGQDYKRVSSMSRCSTHNLCSEMT